MGEEWGWFGTSRISPCVTMASRGLHLQMKKRGVGGERGGDQRVKDEGVNTGRGG